MAKKKRRGRCHYFEERFANLDELDRFYYENMGKKIPRETLEHERAHYDKACELGHEAEFELRYGRNCFTRITIKLKGNVSEQDLIAIAKAPKNPFWEDEMTAKNARERQERVLLENLG